MLKFTEEHEWLKLEGDVATVGITEHAADALGDLVFVQLPEVGATLAKGDGAAVVESVKAASDVFAPLAGEVVEVNEAIVERSRPRQSDPLGAGWFFKLRLTNVRRISRGLMDETRLQDPDQLTGEPYELLRKIRTLRLRQSASHRAVSRGDRRDAARCGCF